MIARTLSRWLTPPVSPWRVILLATIPFWAYLTLHDIIIYESYVLGGTPREMIAAPQVRALQHLLLLPLALFAYRGAWRIGWPEQDRVVAFVGQVLLALAFASLARAALTVSMTVAGWNPALEKMDAFGKASEFEMMRDPFFWLLYTPALWARATTEFFFVYWFGLALVVGLRFYLDLRDQKLAASRLREDWLKARLDALSGQLNPHFLFNSLNTVSSFVRGNPDRAETILADLSQLLRTSLRERTRPLVPVADEIEFIERYLAIEGTRFEDRLKVELEADADVLNARIPSLLLQPLVENAIKHGVSRSRGPASLAVRIGRDGEELRVLIENSHRAGENGHGSGESVGLRNVRERLDTLYAKRHTFAAGPQGDAWRVEIRIPYEQET